MFSMGILSWATENKLFQIPLMPMVWQNISEKSSLLIKILKRKLSVRVGSIEEYHIIKISFIRFVDFWTHEVVSLSLMINMEYRHPARISHMQSLVLSIMRAMDKYFILFPSVKLKGLLGQNLQKRYRLFFEFIKEFREFHHQNFLEKPDVRSQAS